MYHLCQMELIPHVSNSDRQLKDYFLKLCDISAVTIPAIYARFSASKYAKNQEAYLKDPLSTLSREKMAEVRESLFEVFADKFY